MNRNGIRLLISVFTHLVHNTQHMHALTCPISMAGKAVGYETIWVTKIHELTLSDFLSVTSWICQSGLCFHLPHLYACSSLAAWAGTSTVADQGTIATLPSLWSGPVWGRSPSGPASEGSACRRQSGWRSPLFIYFAESFPEH